MTRRIGEDARAVERWLMVEPRGAQGQHGPLGRIEVVDPKVQVSLHGRRRIRPRRRLMARRSLERQVEACLLALAHRVPVWIVVDDRPSGSVRCRNPRVSRDHGTPGRLRSARQRGSRSSTYSLQPHRCWIVGHPAEPAPRPRDARAHTLRVWDQRQSVWSTSPVDIVRSDDATHLGRDVESELLVSPISPRVRSWSRARNALPSRLTFAVRVRSIVRSWNRACDAWSQPSINTYGRA
jgi:hypothetical protein